MATPTFNVPSAVTPNQSGNTAKPWQNLSIQGYTPSKTGVTQTTPAKPSYMKGMYIGSYAAQPLKNPIDYFNLSPEQITQYGLEQIKQFVPPETQPFAISTALAPMADTTPMIAQRQVASITPEMSTFQKMVRTVANTTSEGWNLPGDRFGNVLSVSKATTTQGVVNEKLAGMASVALASLNYIPAWMKIQAGLAAAAIPAPTVAGINVNPAYWVQKGFEKVGELGSIVAGAGLNITPLSEETKNIYRPAIEEAGSLAAMMAVAYAATKTLFKARTKTDIAPKVAENVKVVSDELARKTQEAQSRGEVTPQVAQQIVEDTAKTVKIEQPEMAYDVTTKDGPVKIVTDNSFVLKNLTRGNENLSYKIVDALPKDIDGNQITARFEWDYKNQKGTIYATDATTAASLAHEFGHYLDRKVSGNVQTKLSDLIPDYETNKKQIDAALASYITSKMDVSLTGKELSDAISATVSAINKELKVLSDKTNFGEQFAEAVRQVITNPEMSRRLAPTVTDFIEYNLKDQNTLGLRTQAVAANVPTEIAPVPPAQPLPPSRVKQPEVTRSIFGQVQAASKKYWDSFLPYDREFAQKKAKGEGMELSSIKRGLEREPTDIEFKNAAKYLKSNYIGKPVTTPDGPGRVAGVAFGRIKVTFEDGVTKTYLPTEITGPEVTRTKVLDYLEAQAKRDLQRKADHYNIKYDPTMDALAEPKPKVEAKPEGKPAYGMAHRPSYEGMPPAYDLLQGEALPRDVYTHPDYSVANGGIRRGEKTYLESWAAIQKIRNKPEAEITIYRASPKNELNPGDWVTFSKTYAEDSVEGNEKVYAHTVKAKDVIFAGDDLNEFGYYPAKELVPAEVPPAPPMQAEAPAPVAPKKQLFARTGLETGRYVKRTAFREDKINAPEDVINTITKVSEKAQQFTDNRIAKSNEDVKSLANMVDLTVDDLLTANKGAISNAETAFRARQLITDMAGDLVAHLKSVKGEPSPEQLAIFKRKLFKLQGMMKTVAGIRTEASNLFRQFNIESRLGENDILTEMLVELKKVDAEAAGDIEYFVKKSKKVIEPTVADKLWHVWYMSILSGPTTHMKNILGNTASLLGELSATTIRNPMEVKEAINGIVGGLAEGWVKAKDIMKYGQVSKFVETGKGRPPVVFEGQLKPLNILSKVGDALAAADALTREGFKGMERRGIARDQAVAEGYRGAELDARVQEIIDKGLSEEQQKAVERFGERGVFNQNPQGVIGHVAKGLEYMTGRSKLLKTIVPFTRIVANVLNNSIDYTPIGIKRALVRPTKIKIGGKEVEMFREGGFLEDYYKEPLTPRERGQQLARGVIGTLVMYYAAQLAAEGTLSGNGPQDFRKKQQLQDAGWRPNSIKMPNGKWYSYQYLGPVAVPLTLVANYYDAQKYQSMENKDLLTRTGIAALASVDSIMSMSFLSNIGGLFTAINNWQAGGEGWFENFIAQQATSPVPNAFKQIAGYFDTAKYDPQNIKERIQVNMYAPMLFGKTIQKKVNVFGQEQKKDQLSGLMPSPETKDPLIKFLADNEFYISVPNKSTKLYNNDRTQRSMTDAEYYRYVKESGQLLHEMLTNRLDYIQALPNKDLQEKYIDKTVQDARERTKRNIQIDAYNQ